MERLEFRTLTADEIECRVAQTGKSKNGVAWCSLLLYKDARCDQRLLDETVGCFHWKRTHELINGSLFCTVSIYNNELKEWVGKQDVGTESNTEAEKGQASDAFKRACFNWGLGRELYTSPKIFVTLNNGEYTEKDGKIKVNPKTAFNVADVGYDEKRNICKLSIVDNGGRQRYAFVSGKEIPIHNNFTETNSDGELDDAYQMCKVYIEQAQSRDELRKIIADWPALKSYPKFTNHINERWKEVA